MLFFFKEKPVEVLALVRPSHYFALEYSPVQPAKKMFPQWWKDTSTGSFDWETFTASNTTKSCVGIINQLSSGLIIPAWCDLALQWNDEGYRYAYSDRQSVVDWHNRDGKEAPGFLSDHMILKLITPWVIKSKVKLQYQFPFYHYTTLPPYTVAPGIITPQKEFSAANVFLCVKKNKEMQNLMIKQNTPLMQITPLTERKVIYRVELMSEKDELIANQTAGCFNHFISKGLKNIHHDNQQKNKK